MQRFRLFGLLAGLLLSGTATRAAEAAPEPPGIDSLRTRLAALPADTNRVLVLDELCWQLSSYDLRQAIAYGEQGLALARRLRYRRGQLRCLNDLGNCAMYANDFPAGTRYFLAALKLAQQPPVNQQIIGFAYNGLANLHSKQREYPQAKHYLTEALTQAVQRHAVADEALLAGNLGNVLRLQKQYDPAGRYLRRALALHDSLGNHIGKISCLANLAQLASDQHHWPAARAYARQSNELADKTNNLQYRAINYSLLSGVEQAEQRWAQAREASHRGLAYAQQVGDNEVLAECYQDLATISRQQGDFRQAYTWQQRYTALHDTLVSTAKNEEIAALRVRFDTEQKELRIRALTQQNQLQAAQAAQQRSRLQTLLVLLLAGALAAAGALTCLAQRRRLRRLHQEERLRSRIAADLHDEVGTLLARVSMQADILRQQAPPAASPALDRLLANARAAAGTMRDIVWGIDAQADTVSSLLDRMREHLDQSAAAAGLNTHLAVSGFADEQPLPSELRQHLFLVFKEAVTNAARHAQATDLWVTLAAEPHELRLQVRDNGHPASPATAGRASSGLGLRSMRQRAQALGGTLQAAPSPEGFTVRLVVPLKAGMSIATAGSAR